MVYTAHLELQGETYNIGVEGKLSLTGPESVEFFLHHTGLEDSNPETGSILNFVYSSYVQLFQI